MEPRNQDKGAGGMMKETKADLAVRMKVVAKSENDLRETIERIEALLDDVRKTRETIASVFGSAKARGYDPTAMRLLIKRRATAAADMAALAELDALTDLYEKVLGNQDEV